MTETLSKYLANVSMLHNATLPSQCLPSTAVHTSVGEFYSEQPAVGSGWGGAFEGVYDSLNNRHFLFLQFIVLKHQISNINLLPLEDVGSIF